MNRFSKIVKRRGCDVGGDNTNVHPVNGEGRVGKAGIDKTFTLEKVIDIAYRTPGKPNIIVKAGKNAKWYLKNIESSLIEGMIEETNRSSWHKDVHNRVMYIIEWEKIETKHN
jgi:hypothetical protein